MRTMDKMAERLDMLVGEASVELDRLTEGGFPFSFSEVCLTWSTDSAGIYVHSGNTPVCAVARAGDPEMALREIKEAVRGVVEATRSAVERRGGLKAEAETMAADSEKLERARETLMAAGQDASILPDLVSGEARKAILDAAKEAVKAANRYPLFTEAGGYANFRMEIKGFAGGLVVEMGGKAVLITRFPKVGNAKTLSKVCSFVTKDIAAIAEERRAYFERVRLAMAREERLREIAAKLDAAEAMLEAAAR